MAVAVNKYRLHGENRRGQPITSVVHVKGYAEIRPAKTKLRSKQGVKRMRFYVYNETQKREVR